MIKRGMSFIVSYPDIKRFARCHLSEPHGTLVMIDLNFDSAPLSMNE